jgi:hypothetical protein
VPWGQVFLQDKIDEESGREGAVKARVGGKGASRKTTSTKQRLFPLRTTRHFDNGETKNENDLPGDKREKRQKLTAPRRLC